MRFRLSYIRRALPIVLIGFVVLLAAQTSSSHAPALASTPVASGKVILPPNYDPTRAYPVVEFLPASGASSSALLERYIWDVNGGAALSGPLEGQLAAFLGALFPTGAHVGRDFVLILAAGQGSSSDYSTGDAWAKTLARYEGQVLGDVAALSAARKIDGSRVVVAGFSLGADIAWALALRNPSKIHGAVVMSSRASYRVPSSAYPALVQAKPRFFLSIGSAEDATRIAGARAAVSLLKGIGLPNLYCEIGGANHEAAPKDVFAEALDYVLTKPGTSSIPTPTKPSSKNCRAI